MKGHKIKLKTMEDHKIKFKTEVNIDHDQGIIFIDQHFNEEVTHWTIDTFERATRDGLIKLGWTPPPQ